MKSKGLKEWITEVSEYLKEVKDFIYGINNDRAFVYATKVGTAWTGGAITVTRRGRVVQIRLGAVTTGSISSRTTIATIPAGYRPDGEVYGLLTDMEDYFVVEANGEIRINKAFTTARWGSITYVAWN